mgnify:CR=1 FL=1
MWRAEAARAALILARLTNDPDAAQDAAQTFEVLGELPSFGKEPHDCQLVDGGRTIRFRDGRVVSVSSLFDARNLGSQVENARLARDHLEGRAGVRARHGCTVGRRRRVHVTRLEDDKKRMPSTTTSESASLLSPIATSSPSRTST